jgi:hypothetical protein
VRTSGLVTLFEFGAQKLWGGMVCASTVKNVSPVSSRKRHRESTSQSNNSVAVVGPTKPAIMLRLINRLLGRHENTLPPFDFARNKYPAKKKWPPNLRALTEKQQFRFERKFKRRIKAKSIRPEWNKWTKVVQWSMISFILVYGVLFHDFRKDPMNPRPGEQPFEGLRKRMWGMFGGFYTHTVEEDQGRTGFVAAGESRARKAERD